MNSIRENIHKTYGWFFLAKNLSDYLNMTVPAVMELPATDVFGWVIVFQAEAEMKGYQSKTEMNGQNN